MLELTEGNLLDAQADALVNTVNTEGVMGKGIALQFSKKFPEMFEEYRRACKAGEVQPVLTSEELARMRTALNEVTVRQELREYMVDLIRQTRQDENILVGAGPRATQAVLLSSRAHAAVEGRDFVTPDDVKAVARAVLEHRIVLRPESEIEGVTIPEVIARVLQQVAVPR